jgi:signal transduction histidine kinase
LTVTQEFPADTAQSGPAVSAEEVLATARVKLPRYRRLRHYLVVLTAVTAIAPLVIMTAINYRSDRASYRAAGVADVTRILTSTQRTLEFVIEERRSALSLLLTEQSRAELASDIRLEETLNNLKNSFGGFVDLGLIDSDGNQTHYAGPYPLEGRNYSDQEWFHEVLMRGTHVSDVFMGYRNFPHFVIAIKHDLGRGNYYVLRTTIDMELIYRELYKLELDSNTDVFLINESGILQTASAFYGDVLQPTDIDIPAYARRGLRVAGHRRSGQWETEGSAWIAESPFYLVVKLRQATALSYWLSHRSDLLWFLGLSIALILIVIFYSSNLLVRRLRRADLERARIFHNAEYTNKMATLGRLAAGVAHEINNPLAIINEKAGLMKDMATFTPDFPKKDKVLGLVDSITGSVDRCSRVTHRLLGFARRMDIQKELIDLEPLLKEVVGFQTTEAAHRNIQVIYDIPDSIPSIQSDRGQLQQVFLNLVNNAFAAVPDGGTVNIVIAQPNVNEVAITIRDNGSGIPEEDLKHIFEPFFSTKGQAGTGLGLSITHDIVERLGGLIEVHSELGKGTRFIVNLPVEKVD